jgi:GNAT superfamily N-acetyltransferase
MQKIELNTPKELTDIILNTVLDNEAKWLIESLCSKDRLKLFQEDFTSTLQGSGTKYARTLLSNSINSGYATLILATSGEILLGYAVLFKLDGEYSAKHLHRICVFDDFQNQGVGSKILNMVRTQYNPFTFISSVDNVPFYQKIGFYESGQYVLPETGEFILSSDTYSKLISMASKRGIKQSTAFLLKDRDIIAIAGLTSCHPPLSVAPY